MSKIEPKENDIAIFDIDGTCMYEQDKHYWVLNPMLEFYNACIRPSAATFPPCR